MIYPYKFLFYLNLPKSERMSSVYMVLLCCMLWSIWHYFQVFINRADVQKPKRFTVFTVSVFFFYLSFLIVIICTCRVACIRLCEFLRFLCFKASSNVPQKSFWCTFFSLFSPKKFLSSSKIIVVTYIVCCNEEKIVRLLNFSLLMNVVLLMDSKTLRLPSFHLQQLTYINISFIFKNISILLSQNVILIQHYIS